MFDYHIDVYKRQDLSHGADLVYNVVQRPRILNRKLFLVRHGIGLRRLNIGPHADTRSRVNLRYAKF